MTSLFRRVSSQSFSSGSKTIRQPFFDGCELAEERGQTLYGLDRANKVRFSHENPEVAALYKDYLEKPLSHKAHELLHTDQSAWKL